VELELSRLGVWLGEYPGPKERVFKVDCHYYPHLASHVILLIIFLLPQDAQVAQDSHDQHGSGWRGAEHRARENGMAPARLSRCIRRAGPAGATTPTS
jgi:hypothetical protein